MNRFRKITSNRYAGLMTVALGAMLISFSGVYVQLVQVGPTATAFYRTLIGGILLFLISVYRRERFWNGGRYLLLAVSCGLAFSLDLLAWHKCILFIGPGLATILGNFQVFCLAVVGVLYFGEKLSIRLIVAIPLALTGLVCIIGLKDLIIGSDYVWGVLLGLITAVCYSAYILMLRRLQSGPRPLSNYVNLCITSLICAFFLGGMTVWQNETFKIKDMRNFGILFSYGLFSQVIGWVLITKGLSRIRASIAGLLLLLQPALAFIWDILFFARPVSWVGVGGVFLALSAIYMGTTTGNKNDVSSSD